MTNGGVRRWEKPASGSMKGHHVRVGCGFDPETFETLKRHAVVEKTSVAEQIRRFVEWGIEDVETGARRGGI